MVMGSNLRTILATLVNLGLAGVIAAACSQTSTSNWMPSHSPEGLGHWAGKTITAFFKIQAAAGIPSAAALVGSGTSATQGQDALWLSNGTPAFAPDAYPASQTTPQPLFVPFSAALSKKTRYQSNLQGISLKPFRPGTSGCSSAAVLTSWTQATRQLGFGASTGAIGQAERGFGQAMATFEMQARSSADSSTPVCQIFDALMCIADVQQENAQRFIDIENQSNTLGADKSQAALEARLSHILIAQACLAYAGIPFEFPEVENEDNDQDKEQEQDSE
jgi:hypothetical protein